MAPTPITCWSKRAGAGGYRKYAPGDAVLEGFEKEAQTGRKGFWVAPHPVPPGGALVITHNCLSFGRWMPYWDMGAGMLCRDLAPRIAEQGTPFNFVLMAGPGLQYFATERIALTM